MKDIEFERPIAQIILQHHERQNGTGYPQGLSSEEIKAEARNLTFADVVETMVSHRPYRPALGIDKALMELAQNKGSCFDSQVVNCCLELCSNGGFIFE